MLGIKSIHWPRDYTTYRELSSGRYDLSILKKYQAITDITTVPFYSQLDKVHTGSKFILTVRDKALWLKTMKIVNRIWRKHANANFVTSFMMRYCEDFPFYGWRTLPRVIYRKTHERCIEFQRKATYGGISFPNVDGLSRVTTRIWIM